MALTITVDEALGHELEEIAKSRGLTVTALATSLLREKLDEYELPGREEQPEPARVPKRYSFIGLGASGYTDTSVRMEELLQQAWGGAGASDS